MYKSDLRHTSRGCWFPQSTAFFIDGHRFRGSTGQEFCLGIRPRVKKSSYWEGDIISVTEPHERIYFKLTDHAYPSA